LTGVARCCATLRSIIRAFASTRRRPINSTLTTRTSDAGGHPLSVTTVNYGANGLPLHRQTRSRHPAPGGREIQSEVDCRHAVYDSRGVIVGGHTTTTAVAGDTRVTTVRHFTGTRHCAVKERAVSKAAAPAPHN
jgi:hypothetical protein